MRMHNLNNTTLIPRIAPLLVSAPRLHRHFEGKERIWSHCFHLLPNTSILCFPSGIRCHRSITGRFVFVGIYFLIQLCKCRYLFRRDIGQYILIGRQSVILCSAMGGYAMITAWSVTSRDNQANLIDSSM